jgi:subtilisin family serine protease
MPARRITPALLAVLLLGACADLSSPGGPPGADAAAGIVAVASAEPVPPRRLDRAGTWLDRTDPALWQAVQASGGLAVVGIKGPTAERGVYRGRLLLEPREWRSRAVELAARRGVEVLAVDEMLPIVDVRVSGEAALRALRRLPWVDYVEPASAEQAIADHASVGGCGWGSAWDGDREYTASGDLYSARFAAMGIPDAWTLTSGRGMTIGLIDTGISTEQRQFFEQFSTGESAERTIRLLNVPSKSSPYDVCGHGTRMAGVAVAPNDGVSVAGVAWGASLVSVRHADGVANVSSSDARRSVRLAAQNGSRVVTMAWQSLNWFWQVSDEIEYWHHTRPILFLAAAGTSGCGDLIPDGNVIFPAEMSVVVAVTGIAYPDGGVPCGIHHGKQVELTAYLDVPTTGRQTGDVVGIGGSSNATAIVSGIAALTWAHNPGLTRNQLRERLWRSAAGYPVRDARTGYGLVDAHRAVTGQ